MSVTGAPLRLTVERHGRDQRSTAPPAVNGFPPAVNKTVGHPPFAPHRAGKIDRKTIHRAPACHSTAELFQLPGIQMTERARMMMDQLVGHEAIFHTWHFEQKRSQFDHYVGRGIL